MSDESEQRKQIRLEILKIALANSYTSRLTSIEDVTTALQVDSSIATTELSHLSDNDFLDHSIRRDEPRWKIKGKVRDVMEKKPKTYDEFVSLMKKPQTDFGTPVRIDGPDSTSFGIHLTRKAGGIFATIGVVGIITIVFFLASVPNIEVAMFNSDHTLTEDDDTWNIKNSKLQIGLIDNKHSDWTKVCFRISNLANYIESAPIGANNLKSHITTNAVCKECNSHGQHGFLGAQDYVKDCEQIKTKKNVKSIDFTVILNYNTFLTFSNTFKYSCQFTDTTGEDIFGEHDSLFSCDFKSKNWNFILR